MKHALPVLSLVALAIVGAACGKKKPAKTAAPVAASAAPAAPVPTTDPASAGAVEFFWVRSDVAVRREPDANSAALAALHSGERVPVATQQQSNGAAWAQLRGPGIVAGWIPLASLSRTRTAPLPTVEKPRLVSTGGTGTIRRSGKETLLLDHRALDAEKDRAPDATKPPRNPADDLATLQSLVDELYLDPVTWQPSPERRVHDAAEFRKGLR
ncbi:MAG TPA: SH3 domain-containing protein [bacterium]|nr:SH3 domain-containing protein [bacterium]